MTLMRLASLYGSMYLICIESGNAVLLTPPPPLYIPTSSEISSHACPNAPLRRPRLNPQRNTASCIASVAGAILTPVTGTYPQPVPELGLGLAG